MTPIEWTRELSVGDEDIDRQHQQLVGMVDQLYDAVNESRLEDLTITDVNNLMTFAWNHFQTEEEMFRRIGFPEAEDHIKEHERFVQAVTDFRTRFATMGENVFPELVAYLDEWLDDHLREKDQKYASYLAGKRDGV